MIKAIVTPQSLTLTITIPPMYIGKKIEILLYSKDELTEKESAHINSASRFKGLLTNEEADKYDEYLQQVRNE